MGLFRGRGSIFTESIMSLKPPLLKLSPTVDAEMLLILSLFGSSFFSLKVQQFGSISLADNLQQLPERRHPTSLTFNIPEEDW